MTQNIKAYGIADRQMGGDDVYMEENIITLEEVKEYLRIDYEDETMLNLFIDQSIEYLRDSIDNFDLKLKNERFKKKIKLPLLMLLQEIYDNREFSDKNNSKIKYIINSIMLQLQYCYDDDETKGCDSK